MAVVAEVGGAGISEAAGADDPSLDDFRAAAWRRAGDGRIRVERCEVVRELLRSGFEVEKLLVQPGLLEELRPALEARARSGLRRPCATVCDAELLEEVSGIRLQDRGELALALAWRPPSCSLDALIAQVPEVLDTGAPLRVLAIDGLTDASNVGAVLRLAAAFGVSCVLCSSQCCDPFHVRAVRRSLGCAFHVPIAVGPLPEALRRLGALGVRTLAAIVQEGAVFLDEVDALPRRWALVVGSEHFGVSDEVRRACDTLVKIRMAENVDSLNVVVSAGVLVHGCFEREGR